MPTLLFGILPHVTTNRDDLADALRTFRSDITTYSPTHVPYRLVSDLADYRDTAHLAGDDDEASRMQAMVARHVAAVSDLRRAIAFALVDD